MTRERVEQAIEAIRRMGGYVEVEGSEEDAVEYHEALTTLSNALAESEIRAELRLQSLDHMRDLYDAALERIAESEKERERLREALPEADKLDLLADWFDQDDANKGGGRGVGVQADLRRWARDIRQALSPDSQEKPRGGVVEGPRNAAALSVAEAFGIELPDSQEKREE